MNPRQKLLWRAALGIAEVYARRRLVSIPYAEPLPIDAVPRLVRLGRQAERRGYLLAATRLRPRLERALRDLAVAAAAQAERLRAERPRTGPPPAGAVYWDLVAIDEEFPSLEVDLERRQLRVTTGPITLERVALGPFVLSLDWETLGEERPDYSVAALEPDPPETNPGVTHPHVIDGLLCEGEGAPLLRGASLEGRLYDFVIVVRQLLQTYNRASAYVELDRWHGRPCGDCGSVVDDQERSVCRRCDAELCDACLHGCGDCGDGLCHGCCGACSACDEERCRGCLEPCGRCQHGCCHSCLTEGVCDACSDEEEAAAEGRAATPGAAADAVRLGQAPVPA